MSAVASLNQASQGTFMGAMGAIVTDASKDRLVIECAVQKTHMAPNGLLHGGAVTTLADNACGYLCWLNLPDKHSFGTIELKTNFFASTGEGTVRVVATPVHVGRTTHVYDAEVTHIETGKRLALFRCTQAVIAPKA
jgi:1,4-dihydroxy-2-naphthoyl-CoA hydrolase